MIPEDEYGAWIVLVWDHGTCENITETGDGLHPMSEALSDGHASVRLSGEKIQGDYALQRIDDDADQWLLIKMDDDTADARRNPVSTARPQTAVAPYAIRARPGAPVAIPLHWPEAFASDMAPDRYTIAFIFRRLGQITDPWAGIDDHPLNAATLTDAC